MKRIVFATAWTLLCVCGLALTQTQSSTSKPVKTPTSKPAKTPTSKPAKPPKYAEPSDREVAACNHTMALLYERALKEANPNLHKLQTPHFVIFSGLAPNLDKGIGETMERVYKTLCREFDVAPDESVWVSKCGLFLLTNNPDKQFENFAAKVDGLDKSWYNGASGYYLNSSGHVHIVMNPPPDERLAHDRFAHDLERWKCALVHESTHAFLVRYVSDRQLPDWLNEGIADTSAATVMNSKALVLRMREANKNACMGQDVTPVFKSVGLSHFDYGIAQSWVRFLQAKDPKTFMKFVTLCKEGKNDEDAMKETYKLSRDDFLKAWTSWAKNNR